MQEHISGWGVRLSFSALLLVFSEGIIWQAPAEFNVFDWVGVGLVYLALGAVLLDLIVRLRVNEVFSLLLIAGLYGLLDATLISHITTRDLPVSLFVRPLAAQPLVFLLALAAFQILTSGRATGPVEFGVALAAGLAWGVWVRWLPVVSDEPIPETDIGPALAAVGIGLVVCGLLRRWPSPAAIYRREDWLLTLPEWVLAGGVLVGALALGIAQDTISGPGAGIVVTLIVFILMMLTITQSTRRGPSYLHRVTPPRRPNLAAWLILLIPFLVAGWIGYNLPGGEDSSVQSEILFGALTGFGIVWLPTVSAVAGVRAFVQLAREGQ